MTGRTMSLCVGLMAVAVPAWIVLSDPIGAVATTDINDLCDQGRIHQRRPDVNYAGMPTKHGFQRDHIVPLCLGGADTPANLIYEPLAEAREKDMLERAVCRSVCDGSMTVAKAQAMFLGGGWKASYRTEFGRDPW